MSENSDQTLVTKKGIATDLVLSVLFFLFMREVLVPHVPSQDPTAVLIIFDDFFLYDRCFLDCSQYASCHLG